jgi:hypothetical protein
MSGFHPFGGRVSRHFGDQLAPDDAYLSYHDVRRKSILLSLVWVVARGHRGETTEAMERGGVLQQAA